MYDKILRLMKLRTRQLELRRIPAAIIVDVSASMIRKPKKQPPTTCGSAQRKTQLKSTAPIPTHSHHIQRLRRRAP